MCQDVFLMKAWLVLYVTFFVYVCFVVLIVCVCLWASTVFGTSGGQRGSQYWIVPDKATARLKTIMCPF